MAISAHILEREFKRTLLIGMPYSVEESDFLSEYMKIWLFVGKSYVLACA